MDDNYFELQAEAEIVDKRCSKVNSCSECEECLLRNIPPREYEDWRD
jgi:hypothetical protein